MRNLILILIAALRCTQLTAQTEDSARVARMQILEKADSLIGEYQFENAFRLLREVRDTLDIAVLQRKGQCSFRLGRSTQSIQYYESILRIDSLNRSALNQLGQVFGHSGEFVKSKDCYLRLAELDSTNSYYFKQAASMAAKADDKIMAKWLYDETLALNPSDLEASLALGAILMEWEEFERVDSLLDRASFYDPRQKQLILLKAKSAFGQKKYKETIEIINTITEDGDTTAVSARLLGASYYQLHDYVKVLPCMDYLLAHGYDNDWIYYYCGVAYRELGNMPKSILYLKKAAEKSVSENTPTYYSQLALSYEEHKDYQNAIRCYRAAYNYSKDGIFLYHLARNYDVYYKDKSQAVTYYKKYLASDDTIRLAKEYSKRRIQVIDR